MNDLKFFSRPDSLSVVIPVFNEAGLVRPNIKHLHDALNQNISDYEIIVVNDGSTDGTAAILKTLSEEIDRLKIVTLPSNQGLGAALVKGFEVALKELVLYTDIDRPVDYAEILNAIKILQCHGADMVFGARNNKVYESFLRYLFSTVYNQLIRRVFKVRTREINFAFKLFTKASLKKIHLKAKGSFMPAELVIRAERLGFQIVRFEVDFFPRRNGRSRLFNFKAIARLLFEMIKYYPEMNALKSTL